MSQFAILIPDADRMALSVMPPPVYRADGTLVEQAEADADRLLQAELLKAHNTVRIDEELDVFGHPGSLRHYRMMIRSLPFAADLRLVMRAAQHMLLVEDFEIKYVEQQGLDPALERGYYEVCYTSARESFNIDDDTSGLTPVYIPYAMRRRLWSEMFASLGHVVRWGDSVLNVRKRKYP